MEVWAPVEVIIVNLKFTYENLFSHYIRCVIFTLASVRLNDASSNYLSYDMKQNINMLLKKISSGVLRIENNTKIFTKYVGGR